MIARVAEACFWFGRYLERVESTARVLLATRNLALDAELAPNACWQPVIIVSGEQAHFDARFGEGAAADPEVVQRYMTWDEENLTSLRRSVAAARDNARSIREVVSIESWEAVNELHLWLCSEAARAQYGQHRYGFYRHIRAQMQLCLGLLSGTMLHDTPLDFIWLGTMLERAGQTARILDVHHYLVSTLPDRHQVVETALWLSLLRACSGFEPFMKRYQGQVSADAVASFLILEPAFPRSVRHSVREACRRYAAIRPPAQTALPGLETQERLGALDAWLLDKTPASLRPDTIHALLTHVVDETAAICAGLGRELLGQASGGEESVTQ